MNRSISGLVLLVNCCVGATLVLLAVTRLRYAVTIDSEGWNSWVFCQYIAPMAAGVSLVLGVIPSAILYRAGHARFDLINLWISCAMLMLVCVAWAVVEPLRQMLIFGGR